MPEGPEIKLSCELIKPLVVDKYVLTPNIGGKSRYANNYPENYNEFVKSFIDDSSELRMVSELKVTDVQVKGKFMYWTFSNGWYMFCTYGMSGQWSPTAGKHVCFWFDILDTAPPHNRTQVYFNDPRHFGTIKFTNNKQELINKLNDLGWDPFQNKLDDYKDNLINTIQKSSKVIGELLMDQSLFAGVGNYIRAEALYLSKTSPWHQGNHLSEDQIISICQSIINVMQDSYNHQGATIHTYKSVYGEEGKYSSCFKVYSHKQDTLGNKIIKEKTPEGRTIHWCPAIQK